MISVELKNKQRFELAKAGFYYADEKHEMIGLHLVTDKAFNEIQDIFSNAENTEILKIIADENFEMETYQGFTELGNQFKIETDYQADKQLICLMLKKPILEYESRDDMEFAMMFAKVNMSDSDALDHMTLVDQWEDYIGKTLSKDTRVRYMGQLWKTRQDIQTVLENQYPSTETAALYERIDVEHAGTLEDPIPYDQNMEVFKDKYYLENEKIYKCIRDSGQPLYASCESLLGNYFELVEY